MNSLDPGSYIGDFTYKYILPQESYSSVLKLFMTNHLSSYDHLLTQAERDAIVIYSGADHQALNKYMKEVAENGPSYVRNNQYDLIINGLTSALKKARLKDPIIVYRGLAPYSGNKFNLQVGGVWHGFSSTSVKFITAAHFAAGCSGQSWLFGKGAVVVLYLPEGTPALVVGSKESELLLPPGIAYTVIAEDRPSENNDPENKRCVYTCDFIIDPDFL